MSKEKYQSIVILTGAGISAESGLGTFRDKDGIWTKVSLDDVATPEGFARNPVMVHDFYNSRRQNLQSAEANDAHKALARLEADFDGDVLIVTQNVDDLHEKGGSKNIIHMHGELLKIRCGNCGHVQAWLDDLSQETPCPACNTHGFLRPHVVWFGEMPLDLCNIEPAITACDLFLSIGTSGNVFPAASYVSQIRQLGRARSVELNLEPSEGASLFDECIHGPATEIVPAFVDELLR
jgi:NAD-dependent deacetylase